MGAEPRKMSQVPGERGADGDMPSNLLRARWGDGGLGISDSASRLLTRYQLSGAPPLSTHHLREISTLHAQVRILGNYNCIVILFLTSGGG
jgi:hypothetical protein